MKNTLLIVLLFVSMSAVAQKRYFTKNGLVSFTAGTALEDIDAVNKAASSVFDASTGQIEYAVLIRGFEFRRALMQDHFNENYLESDKYPKSVFKGNILNPEKINFNKDGVYPVTVKGVLEIHGVKKEISTSGTMKVSGEMVDCTATFPVQLSHFDIKVPTIVKDKISQEVNIKVSCNYRLLK
jgi:polyisoprenoid-binding protein YceI